MKVLPPPSPGDLPVIGITIGEPAGIGPEVIRKALRSGKLSSSFRYEVIGAKAAERVTPGRLTLTSARIARQVLETAATRWKQGELAAIVTGPVQKENLARIGFDFPGQTEFFAVRCGHRAEEAVMMLTDRMLTVSLVTTHCALKDAVRKLSVEKYLRTARVTVGHFQRLGVRQPRLALAGVNPHAGENGLFGDEEARVVIPAIQQLRAEGLDVSGPHAPDTVFYRAAQGDFDAVVCAYHDQGLIPFKLLAFHSGVNVTLGLPVIRTSPDHGTALDLAGKNRADASSMIAAIRLACRLVKARGGNQHCQAVPIC